MIFLFLFVFGLGMAGLALLVVGEFSWLGGRKIPARAGRQIGAVLASCLPLALLARFVLHKLDPEETVEPASVYGSVVGLVVVTGLFLLFRAARALGRKQFARASSVGAGANPFDAAPSPPDVGDAALPSADAPAWAPPPVAASKKKPRAAGGKSPFDFG